VEKTEDKNKLKAKTGKYINQMVYKLYNLTPEEIAIVEENKI